jgi:subtilase family serine protease
MRWLRAATPVPVVTKGESMNLKQSFAKTRNAVLLPLAFIAVAAVPAHAGGTDTQSKVAPTRQNVNDLGLVSPSDEMNVTVFLNMHNKPEFDAAVEALYDPSSPTYRKWMTGAALAKYAPTAAEVATVQKELVKHGLTIVSIDPENFSVRAHGTTANIEAAFQTHIHQYSLNGKTFKANAEPAELTGAAGSLVSHVSGLEVHTAKPMIKYALNPKTGKPFPAIPLKKVQQSSNGLLGFITDQCLQQPTTFNFPTPGASLPVGVFYGSGYMSPAQDANGIVCSYTSAQLQAHYGLTAAYAAGLNGKGKTVVLLEAYGYPTMQADANAFSQLMGLPALTGSNFQVIYPQGPPADPNAGVLLGWDGEIALDIQWAHSMVPGAKIVVVAASGQDNEDFQDAIRYITTHGTGHAVSNSWELDTDIIAGAAEEESYSQVLELAAAAGVSVNFSSGDDGDEGLGTPKGAPGVPSNNPWATAVGGTTIINTLSGSSGHEELGWGNDGVFINADGVIDPPEAIGLLGGAGGGESIYFAKPSWQAKLPGTGRQVPDVSALADPYTGVPIVITSDGEQFFEPGIGGTSLASPIFTAIWTLAIQEAGTGLGQAARVISTLPSSAIADVRPQGSPTNFAGTIFDANGSTAYSSADLFAGTLYSQVTFLDADWTLFPGEDLVLSFGTDSSLTVTTGWDNVTGYGSPNGLPFIKAAAGTASK